MGQVCLLNFPTSLLEVFGGSLLCRQLGSWPRWLLDLLSVPTAFLVWGQLGLGPVVNILG